VVEVFTVFYSQVPDELAHYQYLFFGLNGGIKLVPWMWSSIILALVAVFLLLNSATRRNEGFLAIACVAVFISMWIDKGLGLIIPGFIPSQTGVVFQYTPTAPEVLIALGVCALGALVLTVLYKIAISVHEEILD
jgi:Ni/Fe-hydrogenase subunit HybB-like protein